MDVKQDIVTKEKHVGGLLGKHEVEQKGHIECVDKTTGQAHNVEFKSKDKTKKGDRKVDYVSREDVGDGVTKKVDYHVKTEKKGGVLRKMGLKK